MDRRLQTKLADEANVFLRGPLYSVLKARWLEYSDRLQIELASKMRDKKFEEAYACQKQIDAIKALIDITQHIDAELYEGKLDADAALSVIENKSRQGELK